MHASQVAWHAMDATARQNLVALNVTLRPGLQWQISTATDILELPNCFGWWLFYPILCAFYTCLESIYTTISFFSYRFFRSYTYYSFVEAGTFFSIMPASPSDLAYEVKFITKDLELWRIKAVTISAFLYVPNEFEWTTVSDFRISCGKGFYWLILLPQLRR
jgi:hypothetical protein